MCIAGFFGVWRVTLIVHGAVLSGLHLTLLSSHLLQMVMLRNEVCDCRASGVFLRLSAQGLIAENNIHSNGEAGLDIRKGANPIIVVSAASLSALSLVVY